MQLFSRPYKFTLLFSGPAFCPPISSRCSRSLRPASPSPDVCLQ